jgi:hypothetical protein
MFAAISSISSLHIVPNALVRGGLKVSREIAANLRAAIFINTSELLVLRIRRRHIDIASRKEHRSGSEVGRLVHERISKIQRKHTSNLTINRPQRLFNCHDFLDAYKAKIETLQEAPTFRNGLCSRQIRNPLANTSQWSNRNHPTTCGNHGRHPTLITHTLETIRRLWQSRFSSPS